MSFAACSWTAFTTDGWQWPTLSTPTPLVKSRTRLPSTSVTQTPRALAAATGPHLVLVMMSRLSSAMIFWAFGPGIGTWTSTRSSLGGADFIGAGGRSAFAFVAAMAVPRSYRAGGDKRSRARGPLPRPRPNSGEVSEESGPIPQGRLEVLRGTCGGSGTAARRSGLRRTSPSRRAPPLAGPRSGAGRRPTRAPRSRTRPLRRQAGHARRPPCGGCARCAGGRAPSTPGGSRRDARGSPGPRRSTRGG